MPPVNLVQHVTDCDLPALLGRSANRQALDVKRPRTVRLEHNTHAHRLAIRVRRWPPRIALYALVALRAVARL
eukprot:CAMPEP_0173397744 /NCGR_PEP_ID=MMETSP1356-20130122/39372_1 /TAXON_ID=77927 ORGANISM="Hemiselmis virescens, Strain PCC157" /NCGR_SAMPLE_ID=MMETSP1356 /ASSEMBLY_ACC=CAM_ASM_000847 /LENGTH=72 /DNA_ID=CAMNT_0014357073 /DNA_START=25 /DNA_END=240 /DNA_ORIENTATION=-